MTLIELNSLIDNMKIEVNTKTSNLVNAITEQMNQLKISLEEKMRRAYLNTVDRNIVRPTIQSSLTYVTKNTNLLSYNCNTGNGDAVLILISLDANKNYIPPTDGVDYTANNNYGGGNQIGSYYVVGKGNLSSVSITGLNRNTYYHVIALAYDSATKTYHTAILTQNSNTMNTVR